MTPAPRSAHRQPTGLWWCYSRYEIRGGYIRPAPRARLTPFDPSAWPRSGKADLPPYLELAHLVREIPTDQPLGSLDESGHIGRDVLDWCRKHGLLGLLPHTLLSVRLGYWQLHRSGAAWVTSDVTPDEDYEPWGPGRLE